MRVLSPMPHPPSPNAPNVQDMERLRQSGVMMEDIAVSVLPLGTGNDMARTLGCGGGYSGERMLPLLRKCSQGEVQR